jgi:predicted Rossmann fold flavoprotein
VAIRDCLLRARQNGREFARWRGDLLFTHRGVSGPTVLGVSREVAERRPGGPVLLEIDLLPELPFEELSAQLLAWCQSHPRRSIGGFLDDHVPSKVVDKILEVSRVEPSVTGAHLRQKDRNRLVETFKAWPVGWVEHVPLEKGEVVAGGVALDEVDPQSMRSRKVRGLYLCGEILDVAGPVGGYNLQAAFATGYVAGETAAGDLDSDGRLS